MSDPKHNTQKPPARSLNSRPSPAKSPVTNSTSRTSSTRGTTGRLRGGPVRSSSQTSFLHTGTAVSDDPSDDDARAEQNALLEDLRTRVQKAEIASEGYQKELHLLQVRLDESQQSHGLLEEQLHENKDRVEELEMEKSQAARQKRDLERVFDEERTSMLKDRDESIQREEELQLTIQRLKDNLTSKETELAAERADKTSRDATEIGSSEGQFAPPLSHPRGDTNDISKALDQKDRVIKSLRLELAEAQIKIMEIDSVGDGKVHELERALLETKITNARLMEDNESFQLLLSEKTLNGDFSKTEAMQTSTGLGSLAEELGTEDIETAEGKTDASRRLEVEVKSLKDQNKALALYIENIIGRLLSHKEFENLLDKTPDLMSGRPVLNQANTDKELPPPPPEKETEESNSNLTGANFLQRARSVMGGPSKPRSRPVSQVPPPTASTPPIAPGPNENPATAPSIPLGRSQSVRSSGHRRAQSDLPNAAPIVNQMYRGPPSGSASGGPLMSPGISPGINNATRTSFFSPPNPSPAAASTPSMTPRAPSGQGSRHSTQERRPGSSSDRDSTFSDRSGNAVDSPPRGGGGTVANNYTGAVMTQNRLRPLRLVQENPEVESKQREDEAAAAAARKKANRGSWMPAWMGQRNFSGADGNS